MFTRTHSVQPRKRIYLIVLTLFVFGLLAACQAAAPVAAPAEGADAAAPEFVVGALHVGAITDAGYNQAHHDGLLEMQKNLPNVKLVETENIPESADAERVMETMIQQGAKMIFPQSFGYLDPALNVAAKHADVYFEHPSGFKLAPNLATYWGNNFEAMYLAGIAAGKVTKTSKLGFITAFPIPNILASLNAFQLGAKSVNPEVTTTLVINGAWVDPVKEAAATNALADAGVDVVTMIVDSPITIVQTAEERGIYSIGFHSAALKEFAPKGWVTGVAYTWGPLYTRLVEAAMAGEFKSEHLRGGVETDFITLAEYGPDVTDEIKQLIEEQKQAIISGDLKIFTGPISDNQGNVKIAEGEVGGIELLDTTDWLVEGVIGQTN